MFQNQHNHLAPTNRPLLSALVILVVGLVIRFWYYTLVPIGMDEPFTLFHSQQTLPELMQVFRNENNPPLFFLIMHYWIKLFGLDIAFVRIVPAVISGITAPVVFLMINKHFGKLTAWTVTLMFLFSNLQQHHAHDVRAYSLFILLTIWSTHHFLSLIGGKVRWHVLGFALSGVLLIYNHFFGAFVLASQGFVVLIVREFRQKAFKPLAISAILIFLGYIPYLTILYSRLDNAAKGNGGWLAKPNIDGLYNLLWSFCNQPVIVVGCLILILFGATVMVRKKIPPTPKEQALFILFLFPYFGMFIVSQWVPMYLDRYLIFISVAFYLCLVQLAFKIGNTRFNIAISILLIIGFAATFNPKEGHPSDEKAIVDRLKSLQRFDEAVVLHPEWRKLNISYHYDRKIFEDYTRIDNALRERNLFPVHGSANLPEGFNKRFNKAYLITPTSTDDTQRLAFRNVMETLFGHVHTDTIVSRHKLLVYSKK